MIDNILDAFKRIVKTRIIFIVVAYSLLFIVLVIRLFNLQIATGEEIIEEAESQITKEREIKATRGNIYDCNGKLLAYNEFSYTVTLEDNGVLTTNDEKNAMIHRLIEILEEHGNKIDTEFYIVLDKKGNLAFNVDNESSELRFKKNAYARKNVDQLTDEEKNATAAEVYEHLRTGTYMFGISDEYSVEDTLKIMNIRYAMWMNTYAKYVPISISFDVDDRTVAAIKENSVDLPGVEIMTETHRVYNDSLYLSHVLGYTGLVNEKELEDTYYSATDQIGKTGLERIFEEYLRGKKGGEVVALNSSYRVKSVLESNDPVAGDNLYLTIDIDLQKACYHLLEKNLAAILITRIKNSATAGNTAKTTSSNLNIPIYDVYYALIDNNIIDISHFNEKKATDTEKAVLKLYKDKEASVAGKLSEVLSFGSKVTTPKTTSEIQDYIYYFYSFLLDKGYINSSALDRSDETYKKYAADSISLSEFLEYVISSNWLSLSKIGIGDSYYSTEEVYNILIDKAMTEFREDQAYEKMIYKTLVYNYSLSGRDLCILLFDQKVFKKNEEDYNKIAGGVISPYNFIISKIKSLELTPAMLALDPCSGSMVVTDPDTGKVKALVTYPSYDNNKLANKVDAEYYAKLTSDKSLPLINRPTQQKTAPGSTFKMISSVAGLEEGVISPSETILDTVVYTLPDTTQATCWSNSSHGHINVRQAIEMSCNVFFYEVGYRLSCKGVGSYSSVNGLEKLAKYAAKFGLKEDETSGVETYEYAPDISDIDSIRSAIGQGSWSFTPTQINRYTLSIANGGTCNYLTLVDHIEDVNGVPVANTISTAKTKEAPVVDISDSTMKVIKDGMDLVINGPDSSYKSLFSDLNVTVAGKTGTAQIVKTRGNHALFTSYAPIDNPELVVTVVLPYAYTSTNAAKVGSDFYEFYYGKRNLDDIIDSDVDTSDASYQTRVTN